MAFLFREIPDFVKKQILFKQIVIYAFRVPLTLYLITPGSDEVHINVSVKLPKF